MHMLERRCVHAVEHPQHFRFKAFARIDKLCRAVRGTRHTADEMLADPSPNTKSEHACRRGITRAQVNDIGFIPYLAIGQDEELPRPLRIWRHLEEMLERRQDLGATQVSLDLLDVLCRLLQAGLAIGP